jgi:predicted HicB family RNase H-like nuclease
MSHLIEYKGYFGSVHYDSENEIFYGKLEYIRSLINYEAVDAKGLKQAFHDAVEDYLSFCHDKNIKPDMPFKGTFNVRTGSALHRDAAIYAETHHITLNQLIKTAVESYLKH